MTPTTVEGWRVTALADVVYPGLLPGGGAATGHLLTGLDREEWNVIDAFEDPLYELTALKAVGGESAWAYTCPNTSTAAVAGSWTAHNFVTHHLATYVERCEAWVARYRTRADVAR
jgi:gamma-glutamylcyclotransferase (GGCT)/AIG2-like uncharacterized protein YtfP